MAGAGTCVACASAFRITNKQQEENERPLRLLMQGPIFWGVRRRTLRCSNISPPFHRKHCQNLIRKNSLLDQFQMAHSPAIHAKNRNLASLSQNTQEMKATVVE
jgi:hypothetical protein